MTSSDSSTLDSGPGGATSRRAGPSEDHLRLLLAAGIGPRLHARLWEAFGSAERIVRASHRELVAIDGIGAVHARTILDGLDRADPAAERAALARVGAEIVTRDDPRYPRLLATIPDPPPALWMRGQRGSLEVPGVAIVGSRRGTLYGREQASKLAAGLAECGFAIVSGGARGIDAAAHAAALRVGGRTIAVQGCGLGRCYPPEHAGLFEEIAREGLLLSEVPMLYPPRAEGFPRRNRIISGLSIGVVIVEAATRSGALITGRQAAEEHCREVMALPGPVDSRTSEGCHRAIREGWAGLVTGLPDVIEQLQAAGVLLQGADEQAGVDRAPQTSPVRDAVLARLAEGRPQDAASLAAALGIPVEQVLASLTLLQVAGRVIRGPKGFGLRGDGSG